MQGHNSHEKKNSNKMKYLNAASYEIGHTVHLKRAASLSMATATAATAVAAMAETGNYFTQTHTRQAAQ